MTDYKQMYHMLFYDVTTAIHILQAAQQKVEDIYISGEDEPDSPMGNKQDIT